MTLTKTNLKTKIAAGAAVVALSGFVPQIANQDAQAAHTQLGVHLSIITQGNITPIIPTLNFGGIQTSAASGGAGSINVAATGATGVDGANVTANHVVDPGHAAQFSVTGLTAMSSAFISVGRMPQFQTAGGNSVTVSTLTITGVVAANLTSQSLTTTDTSATAASGVMNVGGTLSLPSSGGARTKGATTTRVVLTVADL